MAYTSVYYTMASSNTSQQGQSSGEKSTGATGGGHNKFPCRNYQQEGHPKDYTWVDISGNLCAHCLVSHCSRSMVLQLANNATSALRDDEAFLRPRKTRSYFLRPPFTISTAFGSAFEFVIWR